MDSSSLPTASVDKFTIVELRKLYETLTDNRTRIYDLDSANIVVECLRIIAEIVVYGDNKSELLFDFFCEKNMLSLFLDIMRFEGEGGCPAIVHIQILQTLSILVGCVRNYTSLYYLLSNNYINEIITYPHDFSLAEEALRDQFISFLKSVSLKLNEQTVQFFFIEDTSAFPILTKAIDLLDLPEAMERIAAQSTVLNVYRVSEKRARDYSLRDETLLLLFQKIVKLMDHQYMSVSEIE